MRWCSHEGDLRYFDTSARNRPRRSWDTAKLFQGEVSGAWFDPSDTSTLFQDEPGTMLITATGQPVGRMLDKSGGGHHALQVTVEARPIYRSANGYHWLEFDGVDDHMTLLSPLDMDGGHMVVGLVEPIGVTAHSALLSASTAGYIAITGNGETRSLGKNASGVIHSVDTPGIFAMTSASTTAVRIAGDMIFAQRREGEPELHNATAASSNLGGTNILLAYSSAGHLPTHADLYGLVLCTSWLGHDELAHCFTHMNGKVAP